MIVGKGRMVSPMTHATRELARTFVNAMLTHYIAETQYFACQMCLMFSRSRNFLTV